MAEGLFRASAGEGLTVGSAGVAAAPGSPLSRETAAILKERGIELSGFAARMVDEEILAGASHVFCMTRNHLDMLERMYPEHQDKFHLVCDFAEIRGEVGRDVPDPIERGMDAYRDVAACLDEAIAGIRRFLASQAGAGNS
ncbi:MAG: hypothetical protein HKN82_10085 [Akkermansiaceae bacterium]|nr:hypothetical protein [Akkermansiaceae bacterium]NNM28748.1 hypothetical protein [Akkermansiaceae bacterium]